MKALAKNRILAVYLAKALQDRIKKFLEDAKDSLIPAHLNADQEEDHLIEEDGLRVHFVPSRGRKIFDPDRAIAFLRKTLSKERFNQNFVRFELHQATQQEPPPELIAEMKKYFRIEKVIEVTEEKLHSIPHGIPKNQLEDGCYSRQPSYHKMMTPSKVSEAEIVQRVNEVGLKITGFLE